MNWNASDLDEIMHTGDNLYTVSKKENPNSLDYLVFDEVFPYTEINGSLYHFYSNEADLDQFGELKYSKCFFGSLQEISDVLTGFFTSGATNALFTCNAYSFAVFTSGGRFCIFDSHCRNSKGFPSSSGAAVLCVHGTIENLAKHLMINCGLTDQSGKIRPIRAI